MKLTTISYKKVFPISSFCTEHIGLEAGLDENENPEEALSHLKIMVEDLHKATLSEMEQYRGTQVRTIEPQVKLSPLEQMTEAINQCSTVHVLETFKLIVKNNPDLQPTYDNKLKSLQNGLLTNKV